MCCFAEINICLEIELQLLTCLWNRSKSIFVEISLLRNITKSTISVNLQSTGMPFLYQIIVAGGLALALHRNDTCPFSVTLTFSGL